jgi:hypothetical protein
MFHSGGKFAIGERMTEPKAADPELGQVLFRCRPKSLRGYFTLRFQGALPPFKWLKFLHPVIAITSPVAESLVLAGLPTVLSIFVLQVLIGLKPPHEPSWVNPFCFTVLAVSIPVAMWWCWIAPRKDGVTVHERGFHWQISWSCWNWFRSRGNVAISDLDAFSYRSDCFGTEPVDVGKTTGEKLSRLWLEVNLSHYDITFHLKNNRNITVEGFFARFKQDDLQRFLDHIATHADPHRIAV